MNLKGKYEVTLLFSVNDFHSRCYWHCDTAMRERKGPSPSGLMPFFSQAVARCKLARKPAAPTNSPANVRFMRFCCLGVRSRRNTFEASPV